jgi:hypothetical protein
MLSFLGFEDLNTFAICSKHSQEIRADETLDQTRSGTIVCPKNGATMDWFHDAIRNNGWNTVFTGNRTHLKIKGLDRVRNVYPAGSSQQANYHAYLGRPQLPGVTSLDMSIDGDVENGEIDYLVYRILFYRLPNLQSLDVCNDKGRRHFNLLRVINPFRCPFLTRIVANKTTRIMIDGADVNYISELDVNDSQFLADASNEVKNPVHENFRYMLHWCERLERLSIKNAYWAYLTENPQAPQEQQPVTQDMLIKMVRNLPKLRWLKSDLSAENVAMLKLERPEITFVSE